MGREVWIATDRRGFLKVSAMASTGFMLTSLMGGDLLAAGTDNASLSAELNAYVRVSTEGVITIYAANPEMGQGIKTALPMIIAEEMGAAWDDVEVIQSPIDEDRFGRQGAGGSTTVPRTWNQMRQMGASAREMFISAGALVMEVPREELQAAQNHRSSLRARPDDAARSGARPIVAIHVDRCQSPQDRWLGTAHHGQRLDIVINHI